MATHRDWTAPYRRRAHPTPCAALYHDSLGPSIRRHACFAPFSHQPLGLPLTALKNILALLLGTVFLVLGFLFSIVLLFVFVGLALAVWGFFWWKTRKLRREMRENRPRGNVIEGEVIVVDESESANKPAIPGEPPARQ